jgi:hypothetical protein
MVLLFLLTHHLNHLSSFPGALYWPPFRCVLVPSRQNPPGPRARLSANWLDAVSRKTGLPQNTHATELRHRCTAPSLPLHSAGKVSSLRGFDQRDQSGFGFSAVLAPNPNPLSSRRAGAPTTHLALNNIRSHQRRLNFEPVAATAPRKILIAIRLWRSQRSHRWRPQAQP